ncbi:MAG: oligosaccharide flippase family protein [Methanospirillum sp.]
MADTIPLTEIDAEAAPPAARPSFSKDVLKLVTGTTFAQILVILASPVLTRLFSPEAFGLLAIFTSITKVLGAISCLRYEFAIMLPDEERDAVNLLALCVGIVTGISLLALPFFIVFEPAIVSILNSPGLTGHLWLVSPFVFVSGLFVALNYWNSRTRRYGRLAVARIVSSVAITGGQLAAGAAGIATGGALIGASAFGQGVATGVLGAQILRDDRHIFGRHLSRYRIKAMLVRYKRFPLYDSWSGLLNVSSWQLPSLLLPIFFSPVQVGYYALAFRLIVLPMDLIGSAIQQVFFQRASNAERDGDLAALTESVFTVLLRIGLFPMLTVALIGEELFSVVFGAAWAEAGLYTQLLAVWAVVWFISAPLSTIYMVKEKQAFGLQVNIANFVTRLAALVTGGVLGSARLAILLFGVSGIAVYGFLCVRLLMFSGIPMRRTLRLVADALLPFLPVGAALFVLKLVGTPALIHLALGILAVLIYYVYLLRSDEQFREVLGGLGVPGMR